MQTLVYSYVYRNSHKPQFDAASSEKNTNTGRVVFDIFFLNKTKQSLEFKSIK